MLSYEKGVTNVAKGFAFTARSNTAVCSVPVENFVFIINFIHFGGNSATIKY